MRTAILFFALAIAALAETPQPLCGRQIASATVSGYVACVPYSKLRAQFGGFFPERDAVQVLLRSADPVTVGFVVTATIREAGHERTEVRYVAQPEKYAALVQFEIGDGELRRVEYREIPATPSGVLE